MRMTTRVVTALTAASVALGLAVSACGSSSSASQSLRVRPCKVQGQPARCGTLMVPENRLTGRGRMIPIRFVVIPAYGPGRAPDPVVYFAGGPGGSAVGDISSVRSELGTLNQHRDLVFIDQRGTGGSNLLRCPPPPAARASRAQIRRGIQSCLASLRRKADMRFYTSAMAARDTAQVLSALGYGKVNLFGGSYGATAAQVFQLMFPAKVRTMTLLGGTLLNIPLFERFPQNSQHALDVVLARCDHDRACHRAFPRLAAEWAGLRALLAVHPVTIPAASSPTGTAIRIDDTVLAGGVHQMLLAATTAVYVPLLIHSAYAAHGRTAALRAVIGHLYSSRLLPTGGGESAIGYPIRCAEPWARFQLRHIADPASYYYPASVQEAQWWRSACTFIPTLGAAASYAPQRPSLVPVLMINGTADPQDPPANMAGARNIWPDSRQVAEPVQAHMIDLYVWWQCDSRLVQAFVTHASAARLDTRCLAQVARPTFALHW
jgi:pimeloyl-ACP methyl ester carboxylesterase